MPSDKHATWLDLDAYTVVVAALSVSLCREDTLLAHGLDEATWAAVDDAWQAKLSSALDEEHEGVPPLVAAYAEAFDRARASLPQAAPVLSLEQFIEATRAIERLGDPQAALEGLAIPLASFLRASELWTRRMLQDPTLADQFRARRSG